MDPEDGPATPTRDPNGGLWRADDESYYGANGDAASKKSSDSGGRWHYPANFDDAAAAAPDSGSSKKKKKKSADKKDRWARTEDAYSISEEAGSKKKKKKRSKTADVEAPDGYNQANASTDFPEDAEGGLYGGGAEPTQRNDAAAAPAGEDIFAHQF